MNYEHPRPTFIFMLCRHASYISGVAAGHAAEGKPKTRLASSRRGARNAPILRFPISYGELFEHCYVFFWRGGSSFELSDMANHRKIERDP